MEKMNNICMILETLYILYVEIYIYKIYTLLSARNQVVGSGYSIILTFFQFQVGVYARTQMMFNKIV